MAYKALTYVNLPPDNRKSPGQLISDDELDAAGQTDEDVQKLIDEGAIGDEDAQINEAHAPVEAGVVESSDVNVVAGDEGGGT